MSDVTYRHARREDLFEVSNVIRSAFDGLLKDHGFWDSSPFASARMPPLPPSGPFPWFELGLKEDSDGFWVAEVGNKLAGIGLSWVRGSLWYLAHLFVLPQYQGRDIGRNLMDCVMQHGKESEITNRALGNSRIQSCLHFTLQPLWDLPERAVVFHGVSFAECEKGRRRW